MRMLQVTKKIKKELIIQFLLKNTDEDIHNLHHNLQIHLDCMDCQSQNYHSDDDARVHRHLNQQHQLMLRQEMDDVDDAYSIQICLIIVESKTRLY